LAFSVKGRRVSGSYTAVQWSVCQIARSEPDKAGLSNGRKVAKAAAAAIQKKKKEEKINPKIKKKRFKTMNNIPKGNRKL
jgi:hypothetical protein